METQTMMLWMKRNLAVVTAITLAAIGVSCSKEKPTGAAKIGVTVSTAATATSIVKMTLTVGPGTGTPTFTPIVTDLTNNDLTNKLAWSAFVQGIPAGTGRTFHIDAFNSANAVIYTGNAVADIVAGGTANVFLVLQGPNDGGFNNSLPVVDSLTSSASLVTV